MARPPVNRPEQGLIGVMYETVPVDGDVIVTLPSHPLFSGVNCLRIIGFLACLAMRSTGLSRTDRPA